jgi:integrase
MTGSDERRGPMATVRKRTWKSGGETKTAWIADYFDQDGKRHIKTCKTKKEADGFLVQARHEVARGVHTPENASITVAEAGKLWIETGEIEKLERSTLRQYGNHLKLHINPLIGGVKLARLSTPGIEAFRNELLKKGSRAMARKVLSSLKSILGEAQRRGLIAQNSAQPVKVDVKKRDQRKLAVGRDIPSKEEVQSILKNADGRWRPLFITAIFTGMRSSELRGLTWDDIDFDKKVIHVRQRADHWGVMGAPKSAAGHRDVPMSPMVVNALKEWRLACPRHEAAEGASGHLWLVFPNGNGRVENHANIANRGFYALQLAAGIAVPDPEERDDDGNPAMKPKYGMHALRHFFASWAIEQGFSPKRLQTLLGHSSIQMTFDVYGHLFPSLEDDHAKFAAGELSLIG